MTDAGIVQHSVNGGGAASDLLHAAQSLPGVVQRQSVPGVGSGVAAAPGDMSAGNTAPQFATDNRNGGATLPDLERLADEVYNLIERRITIERESLGI